MDKSKIKNFIIIVLALVNIFLLAIVISDYAQSSASSGLAKRRLSEALAENGITISEGVRIPDAAAAAQSARRDMSMELRLVKGVLGKAEAINEGGNIYTYASESGRAYFRGTGEFAIEPAPESIPEGASAEASAERYLRKMGLSFDRALTEVNTGEDGSEVTFICETASGPVFNCRVTLTFRGGYLILAAGRRPLDAAAGDQSVPALDAVTALLRFIDIIRENGYVCSEISGVQAGFTLGASASGEGTLTPVWRISTDTGEYYVNGLTGMAETF